jgi:hypothetical protein
MPGRPTRARFFNATNQVDFAEHDRELASRILRDEIKKHKKTDPKASTMTLCALLDLYEKSIQGLATIDTPDFRLVC